MQSAQTDNTNSVLDFYHRHRSNKLSNNASNWSRLGKNYLDGGLQLDNSHAMPCLSQVDLENVFHSVMMSLCLNVSTFLHGFVFLRSDLIVRRLVLSISSVSSVYLNRKIPVIWL